MWISIFLSTFIEKTPLSFLIELFQHPVHHRITDSFLDFQFSSIDEMVSSDLLSILIQLSHCPHSSGLCKLWNWKVWVLQLCSFIRLLAILGSLNFLMDFRISFSIFKTCLFIFGCVTQLVGSQCLDHGLSLCHSKEARNPDH